MRHRSALFIRTIAGCAGAMLLLAFAGVRASAVPPLVFDAFDWTHDRGDVPNALYGPNPVPLRLGYNDFLNAANDAGDGTRKWVYPRTDELNLSANGPGIIDNPDPDPNRTVIPFQGTTTNGVPGVVPPGATSILSPGVNLVDTVGTNTWTILPSADRAPGGGYSYPTDTGSVVGDYAAVLATHNDFVVTRTTGSGPATPAELAQLPNAPAYVYSVVNQVLVTTANAGQPFAQWTSGTLDGAVPGAYAIDLSSPGDGSIVNDGTGNFVTHPNVTRAFVRVSWGAAVNDPTTSRIFMVDLSAQGWIRLHGGGLGTAAFPYDGVHPLVVTLYTITPDNPSDTSIFLAPPLVTADAVRFTRLWATPYAAGNFNQGRILGPAVSAKLQVNGTPQPFFFFAREEYSPDTTTLRTAQNPLLPVGGGNAAIADPTATTTAPVFYAIDNEGNVDANGQVLSTQKTLWRYVGAADTGGTSSASPLIADVRCRDGVVRTILYFVTTSADGSLGHVYALDPYGDPNNQTGVFNPADPTGSQNTGKVQYTWAYWVYPSYRPGAADGTTGPVFLPGNINVTGVLNQYLDPNYSLKFLANSNISAAALAAITTARAATPPASFGADPNPPAGDATKFDGDITLAAGVPALNGGTQTPTFGGVQSSPLIIDDPENPNGAQLLILGNMNGRVYAFDAGGRGDYGYQATYNLNPFNNAVANVPGTTQRIWTWPRLGGDAFGILSQNRTNLNVTQPNNEPAAGAFPSSPAFDPANTSFPQGSTNPVLIGSADGHLYALDTGRDRLKPIGVVNGNPVFIEKRHWVYPNLNSSLGVALSTPAIYKGNVYFTCGGRVYSVSETPTGVTSPQVNALTWVYPATNQPPNPDPTANQNSTDPNVTTVALSPGFVGAAPILVPGATIDNAAGLPTDLCYVLQSDGQVLMLNAAATGNYKGVGATTQVASGGSLTGSYTRCSPILAHLVGQVGFDNTPHPTIVFADDSGAIYGLNADPIQFGGVGANNFLEVIWTHQESTNIRAATAMLANHIILEGDEGGQMRAYGPGQDTSGSGEPPDNTYGPNYYTIDERGVDVYAQNDFNAFMLGPNDVPPPPATGPETPNEAQNGHATPLGGNGPIIVDWGDNLYVAAWGVYHAKNSTGPNDPNPVPPPNITVTFTVSMPYGSYVIPPITVPAIQTPYNPAGGLMPDDLGVDQPTHNSLSINGLDNTGNVTLFQGPTQGVYPWVAKAVIPIRPDANHPFSPGATGYSITARAQIGQAGTFNSGNTLVTAANTSNTLFVGQRDLVGDTTANYATRDNGGLTGTQRQLFVANPLSLTASWYEPGQDMSSGFTNMIGWAPEDASKVAQAGLNEILGNLNNPVDPTSGANQIPKPIYAPIGMTPDGTSVSYTGINSNGTAGPALALMDRSALALVTGKPLTVRATTNDLHFWGGASSVMNPLPWEQMPTDTQASVDYPSIPATAMTININGQNAINTDVPLNPPTANVSGQITDRTANPTEADLSVSVPKYQPANVNRGVTSLGGKTFGEAYTDISGTQRGTNGSSNAILGPMFLYGATNAPNAGSAPTAPGPQTFPAGGYIGQMRFDAGPITASNTGGVTRITQTTQFQPDQAFQNGTNLNVAPGTAPAVNPVLTASRLLEAGLSVVPNFKMRMVEETIDLGKLPHGTGYADTANGNGGSVFAPTGFLNYTNTTSPWDDDTKYGKFFRPFTLENDSNVNMVNLRLAKLKGYAGATVSTQSLALNPPNNIASSARLTADDVDGLSTLPLFALPFGNNGTVGNLGVVSSFDHASSNSGSYAEINLWGNGLNNPEVTTDGINAITNPTNGQTNGGILVGNWANSLQPLPVGIKPRVGDSQGEVVMVPAQPHDTVEGENANVTAGFFNKPEMSVAVPVGTPAGTYAGYIYAYEDNTPIQWREWVNASTANIAVGADNDGILNIDPANTDPNSSSPVEAISNPTAQLKLTVKEARLTEGVTPGTIGEIDPMGTGPLGPNLLPAAFRDSTPIPNGANGNIERDIFLYWATNRQPANSTFVGQVPPAEYPYSLAFSALPSFIANLGNGFYFPDYNFGVTGNDTTAQWWSALQLFPNNGLPTAANLVNLFPNDQASANANNAPFLAGTPVPQTAKFASAAVAQAVRSDGVLDPEAWLFWQGVVDKSQTTGAQAIGQQDSRTFYTKLVNGVPQQPALSFLNDPALTKLSPKPLLVKLASNGNAPAQSILYLFWHAGNQSHTALYYDYNVADSNGNFSSNGWVSQQAADNSVIQTGDQKLPTPGALVWQSDPYPVYRQVVVNNQLVDAVDVVYTGMLKNRQSVEVLLTRYVINRTPPATGSAAPVGQLAVVTLPAVQDETLTRVGKTNTFAARDAAWFLGGPASVQLKLLSTGAQINTGRGQLDTASGLVYYNSNLGGQLVVDIRSGTVTFPNVPPNAGDGVVATYIPQVMRLSASRDETNILRENGFGGFNANDPAFQPHPATTAPGDSLTPIAILDRGLNPRVSLVSPPVVYTQNNAVAGPNASLPIDRLWVLYRKSDVNGAVKSTIYYKSMRLMVRLPRPVALSKNPQTGISTFAGLSVTGNLGPYEVDWARGRIYFTEQDEGSQVQVSYTADQNGTPIASGNLAYRVAWGDEISSTAQPSNPNQPFADATTPEVPMPTDSTVNEGQVAAFKDPFSSKLWVFWTSTRANTTDLYYETLAPQFYSSPVGEH